MAHIKCIAVDDNELDRLTLHHYLKQYGDFEILGIYDHPKKGLKAIQDLQPEVIFLDVDMPEMSGMAVRKEVAAVPICVFITDHPEFAVDGFALEALDYLVKPITEARFKKTVNRIREYTGLLAKKNQPDLQDDGQSVFIKEGHKKVKIALDAVLYLETLQNYTILVTAAEKHHMLTSLSALLKEKRFKDFIRIHRSYAVQKKQVKGYSANEIILTNGEKIGIGRSYKKRVQQTLNLPG